MCWPGFLYKIKIKYNESEKSLFFTRQQSAVWCSYYLQIYSHISTQGQRQTQIPSHLQSPCFTVAAFSHSWKWRWTLPSVIFILLKVSVIFNLANAYLATNLVLCQFDIDFPEQRDKHKWENSSIRLVSRSNKSFQGQVTWVMGFIRAVEIHLGYYLPISPLHGQC